MQNTEQGTQKAEVRELRGRDVILLRSAILVLQSAIRTVARLNSASGWLLERLWRKRRGAALDLVITQVFGACRFRLGGTG